MWHLEFETHLKSKAPQVNLKWYYGCGGVRVYREPYVQFLWDTWKVAIRVAQRSAALGRVDAGEGSSGN